MDIAALIRAYIDNNMKEFYGIIQKLTRAELANLTDILEGISIVTRRVVNNWDDIMQYPSNKEE